ncbi:hypothetical protein JCM3766R1_004659 [Sporobolomyces carnicolor]
MLSTLSVPLVGLAFEPESHHSHPRGERKVRRSRSQSPTGPSPARPSPPGLAWFPVETSFSSSSSRSIPFATRERRSLLNPETPAFEPLSPPQGDHDATTASPLDIVLTSPNRRRTLELPPSPPDSPPKSHSVAVEPALSFARSKGKASRGRAPTRLSSIESRQKSTLSTASPRRARPSCPSTTTCRSQPIASCPRAIEPATIVEEDDQCDDDDPEDDDERFLSLPLLRLRHRLSTSLTLSTLANGSTGDHSSSERSTSPPPPSSSSSSSVSHRRRRSFPPGTVWAEQSHYRLYALQRSKADRTSGVGYWKRWEGVDLE